MFNESINYLRTSEDWVKTVLIGGILAILGFLIIPAILVVGYLMRVLRARMHGEEEPPVFDEWGDMLRDGAYGFAIGILYAIVPAVVGAVLIAVGVGGAVAGGDSGAAAFLGGIVALVGGLVLLVLSLVVGYVLPAALANYVEKERFGAAFSVADLRPVLFSGKYATAWVIGLVIVLVAGFVSGLLNVVPLLGAVVGAFVSFYAVVAAYYCIGTAWGELQGMEMVEEGDSPDEQPAV
jgi:MFS family permease